MGGYSALGITDSRLFFSRVSGVSNASKENGKKVLKDLVKLAKDQLPGIQRLVGGYSALGIVDSKLFFPRFQMFQMFQMFQKKMAKRF